MRHKLFLCAVCKIASIECSCLPSATKWVQCDCECAVERLGSGGAGALIPNVQLVTPGRYTPLRGTTTRYTSLCTWTFLMWKHIVVVVPAYKNRTTHSGLNIIVSHVTKFHGFWTRFKLEIILFWSSALFLLSAKVYLAQSWEMAEDLCGWGRRALWRQQRCYTDAYTGELGF